jgi:hypothetical protein
MQKAAAATLFCHLQLVNLEQEQSMVSCKAKKNSRERYQLNPKDTAAAQRQATMFLLSKRHICGITRHIGNYLPETRYTYHLERRKYYIK